MERIDSNRAGLRILAHHSTTRAHCQKLTRARHRCGRNDFVGGAERCVQQLVRLWAAGVCRRKIADL